MRHVFFAALVLLSVAAAGCGPNSDQRKALEDITEENRKFAEADSSFEVDHNMMQAEHRFVIAKHDSLKLAGINPAGHDSILALHTQLFEQHGTMVAKHTSLREAHGRIAEKYGKQFGNAEEMKRDFETIKAENEEARKDYQMMKDEHSKITSDHERMDKERADMAASMATRKGK